MESLAQNKHKTECKQKIQKLVEKWLPEDNIMLLDSNAHGLNLLRKIGNQKQKSVFYRDRRPHLYGEEIEYVPDLEGPMGVLRVTGYLRGTNSISVNGLVHIPGLGDFQMLQIEAPYDSNQLEKSR